jgi:hypothetical protein
MDVTNEFLAELAQVNASSIWTLVSSHDSEVFVC